MLPGTFFAVPGTSRCGFAFVLVIAGRVYAARSWDPLCECFVESQDGEFEVWVLVVGCGVPRSSHTSLLDLLQVEVAEQVEDALNEALISPGQLEGSPGFGLSTIILHNPREVDSGYCFVSPNSPHFSPTLHEPGKTPY